VTVQGLGLGEGFVREGADVRDVNFREKVSGGDIKGRFHRTVVFSLQLSPGAVGQLDKDGNLCGQRPDGRADMRRAMNNI